MRTVRRYICDVCGAEYNDAGVCAICEDSHLTAPQPFRCLYDRTEAIPWCVYMKFPNGKTVTYHKMSEYKEDAQHE